MKTVATLESELSQLKEENNAYESQVTSDVDLNNIKKIAIGRLGMNYPTDDQKKTYSVPSNSYVRQYQDITDAKRWEIEQYQTEEQKEEIRTKDFFDMILPGTVKFQSDHYILGDSYRCVWAIREYPPSTEEQAILSQLADRSGVTVRI